MLAMLQLEVRPKTAVSVNVLPLIQYGVAAGECICYE
jgi:hypothetical protein